MYLDMQSAFIWELNTIINHGEEVSSRLGDKTKEVLHRSFTIEHPERNLILTPHRANNPFAMWAETMWVLAGRNDLAFLNKYLPRATEFSDDGLTWRAGYGKRLRDWNGIDQLQEIVKILQADPNSRRAVAVIYDPDRDFIATKDTPCNDLLQFLIRDGKLHMSIYIRSNDIMWGWSAINSYEWSILQQVLASILKVEVGQVSYFMGSFHIYDRHYGRAKKILDNATASLYSSDIASIPIKVSSLEELDAKLRTFFEIEESSKIADPNDYFAVVNNLLLAYRTKNVKLLEYVPASDMLVVAIDYAKRNKW